jgi:LysM repeat protein
MSGNTSESSVVKKYRIKRGDSLNRIARRYGMTLNQLRELNGMSVTDNIFPGQVIFVK